MTRRVASILSSTVLLLACAAAAAGQTPRITNGRVTAQQAASPFDQAFRTLVSGRTEPTWIGYMVPVVEGERRMCCSGSGSTYMSGSVIIVDGAACCTPCRLEPGTPGTDAAARTTSQPGATGPVKLEGPDEMAVLFRVEAGRVERIRVFSPDCELDAGGRAVVWLENVRPADSIAMLEGLTAQQGDRRDRVIDGAISAIALHRDAAADASLERLAAPSQPVPVRRKVTFWLGNARAAQGLELLKRIVREDQSVEVRKSAVFGVSQSKQAGAFDVLAGMAGSDSSPAIRGEAVFWLAQQGDERAPKIILEALEKDSSPAVRKKAVFALSQLRDNAGVDALIQAARAHSDASVRGEAIFWLGQKAGAKAASEITARIEQDPDTDVKKRAVFALSQFPRDEGVPALIKVARTNNNPAVRKQAMFWLAQSRDPRAIDFFADILK